MAGAWWHEWLARVCNVHLDQALLDGVPAGVQENAHAEEPRKTMTWQIWRTNAAGMLLYNTLHIMCISTSVIVPTACLNYPNSNESSDWPV